MRRRPGTALVVLATLIAIFATAAGGLLTVRLYTPSPLDRTDAAVVDDAVARLRFLRSALDGGSAERMQGLFPEGYFFSYVLYGLTWVDVGSRDPRHRPQALAQARWALAHLDSPAGRAPFDAALHPAYGVFYAGWSGWLRGGVIRLAGGASAAPEEARGLADTATDLADAFRASLDTSGSPFLSAYPGQAWAVDSAVGIATVHLSGSVLGTATGTDPLVRHWLAAADARRDPATGLLPHRVEPATGTPVGGARATSQTVLLRFLREVDPVAAARDWWHFRDRYASTVPGVPGLREYPRGVDGAADVDSGPLPLGLSGSASAVGLGDAILFGDRATASRLTGLAEATGGAVAVGGTRRYLGGAVPIGDGFLAWSVAARGWLVPADRPRAAAISWWRLPWHLVTVGVVAPCWLVTVATAARRRRIRRLESESST